MKKVALLRCTPENITDVSQALIGVLGGMERFVKKGNTVLIKPNVLCAQDATTGATTSPALVGMLAKMCYDAGAGRVVIGESSNWGIDTMESMTACGYGALVDQYGVELLDFKKDDYVPKKIDGLVLQSINIPKAVEMADVVINCPVLKAHTMTKVTLGIKNFSVGISHDMDKKCTLHRIGTYPAISDELETRGSWLDCAIADINSHVKTTLTVIDGILGLHGPGAPLFGYPIHANLLLASEDRVAVDSIGSWLLGYDPKEVHHINNSYNYGCGEIDIKHIEVVGDAMESFQFDIKHSYNTSLQGLPNNVTVVDGCRNCKACLSTATYVLSRHRDDIEEMGIPIIVYVGKFFKQEKPKPQRGMHIYYGNCAGSHIYGGGFVPGCPPRSRRQFIQAIGALDIYKQDEVLETDR